MTSHPPAVFSTSEIRAWLRSLGLTRVRLPHDPSKVLYVDQPGGGAWRVRRMPRPSIGAWRIDPMDLTTGR